jgi:hypothetical protein
MTPTTPRGSGLSNWFAQVTNAVSDPVVMVATMPWKHCQEAKQQPIVAVEEHAWNLGWILGNDELPGELHSSETRTSWYSVSNWLMAAGGLHTVRLNLDLFDESAYLCPSSFAEEEQELLDNYVRDLARFSFVWQSFEATLGMAFSSSFIDKSGGEAALEISLVREFESTGGLLRHSDCAAMNLRASLQLTCSDSGSAHMRKQRTCSATRDVIHF